jgi:DNA-binding transcriptional LysR family regulator
MDIKHLAHIVALADKRNFARAAEQLNLSQPALSRSIQSAELKLGLRLFDRGNTEVTPTAAGEFVLERARRLVFDSRCLKRDVELYRDRSLGDVAFGVGPYPAATFLAGLLTDLRTAFPSINLRVSQGNWALLAQQLRAEDIEFFVSDTRDLPKDSDLVVQQVTLLMAGFFVRAGHPILADKPDAMPSLPQMWAYGIATVRIPSNVRTLLAQALQLPAGATLPVALECDDVPTLKRVALATDTVLAAPHDSVVAELSQHSLVRLSPPGFSELGSHMGIITLRGRTPSPMAEVIMRKLPIIQPCVNLSP